MPWIKTTQTMSKKRKQRSTCRTEDCENPPAPGSSYCPICAITAGFQKQVDRANRRGDTLGALLHTFLAFGTNALRQSGYVQTQSDPMRMRWPGGPRRERPPGVHQPDPFKVLGLDPATATEKDVRRIQQGAAAMWHEDKGGGREAQQRLAEINAAAEACLKKIRARSAAS
jgi:hypothetical protein